MTIPEGWKLDIDAANRRFRVCANVAAVTGQKDAIIKSLGDVCTPWVSFEDAIAEAKRAGANVAAEGGRFVKTLKRLFGFGGGK